MSNVNMKKPMVTDIFVEGAKKGWVIATTSTVPNVLMAFVIIKALQITGALDLMGTVFSPVMAVFGLPGEAAAVLIGAWMSMGGAVGVVITLFDQGILNGTHIAILAPAIY
ncbi:nucleoside recognition domain-containing protein, partial [Klebsiella pneumoniae]